MTRYAFISDIHGNFPALVSVLRKIMLNPNTPEKGLGIPRQNIRCLGDLVGYYPYPNQCVEMVSGLGILTLKGNHDQASADDINLEKYFIGWREHAKIPIIYTRKQLSPKNKAFLQGLEFIVHENGFGWAHSNPMHPEDFLTYLPQDIIRVDPSVLFGSVQEPVFFVAHAHHPSITYAKPDDPDDYEIVIDNPDIYRPYELSPNKIYIINIGAVGQPRDHDPRACFVVYDDQEKTVQFFRVAYDGMESVQELTRKTFPEKLEIKGKEMALGDFLADRLSEGI